MKKSIANLEHGELKQVCLLESAQLTSCQPILFARIVYHDFLAAARQEVIGYADRQTPFAGRLIDYLRSEEWLLDYPPVYSITEFTIDRLSHFSYLCPFGYRHQQPEYIHVITDEPLSESSQQQLKRSATLLSKYLNLYFAWHSRTNEVKILEQVLQKLSHQMRNSLGLIALYVQNLCFGLRGNPWQEQAEIIAQSIQKLDLNLDELIECSQCESLSLQPQDLRKLVLESINFLQAAIGNKKIDIQLPETSVILMIDRLQLKQVFDNLLSNAIYFSPIGGKIICNWQIFQSEVLIKITDQGPGLSAEDLPKIFNPFYSRREGGTGLGLTIAKKIVLDHQGSLWAQNLAGGGAQFSLILAKSSN